jgi:hypothetical protein
VKNATRKTSKLDLYKEIGKALVSVMDINGKTIIPYGQYIGVDNLETTFFSRCCDKDRKHNKPFLEIFNVEKHPTASAYIVTLIGWDEYACNLNT